ncbi:unnamed protein product, partial [Fusarium fujikuroi]
AKRERLACKAEKAYLIEKVKAKHIAAEEAKANHTATKKAKEKRIAFKKKLKADYNKALKEDYIIKKE